MQATISVTPAQFNIRHCFYEACMCQTQIWAMWAHYDAIHNPVL